MRRGGIFLMALLAFASAAGAEGFSFSIEPARVELTAPAGKRRGKVVVVNNSHSDKPLHLRTYMRDVVYTPDGTHEFPEAGSTEWSCASWLQVTPAVIDVPAKRTAEVRISATAPADAKGGHYAIVFFESEPTLTEIGVGINFRIGALVEVAVPNTTVMEAKLTNMLFQPPKSLVMEIFNNGNVLVRPKGKIKLQDAAGNRTAELDFNAQALGILPRTLRRYVTPIESPVAKGTYRAKAEIDYGSRYLLVGELPVTIE